MRFAARLRRFRASVLRWAPVVWRPVLSGVAAAAALALVSTYPAPSESSAFTELADPLRAGGVPEEVIDRPDCGDGESDFSLDCEVLAVEGGQSGLIRIAVGTVSNVAGYWSGSEATLQLSTGPITATTRETSWGSELPISFGRSTVWIDVVVPSLSVDGDRTVTGQASVEVRYPKSTTTQQGNVNVSGFTNTSTVLTRPVVLFAATAAELDQLTTLAATTPTDYPLWQDSVRTVLGIGVLGAVLWLTIAVIRETRRGHRLRSRRSGFR